MRFSITPRGRFERFRQMIGAFIDAIGSLAPESSQIARMTGGW